ncbi:RagB/SusD family nutrient uptake outer membrane protein [uncultured Polaribacter sp.]|uniref:RagB/SusD family nutrient uptake outer membrane protein n=1 Tax=uncultured Polaribacter sp. TaxID=174711 RepID=UPI002616A14E|nr:RagB/SusD family nutrient uptake outer membrane protein [uncultured Polaribacter sp.]
MNLFIKNAKIFILVLTVGCMSSCELVNVTDVEPVFQISDDKVITNIGQAEEVLQGAYSFLIERTLTGFPYITTLPGISGWMGLTQELGVSATTEEFFNNNVSADNAVIDDTYPILYELINNANHVISKTELLTTTAPRKNEIIAEAKFLRALSHFYLLRLFGEFFDVSSPYGVILKETPTSNVNPQPRASVEETYQSILNDLDDAIQNAPDFSTTLHASKIAAEALKSKVLLYKKEYNNAATLALKVINSGERSLEDSFGEIFTKKIDNPLEAIFQASYNTTSESNGKQFYFAAHYVVSNYYVDLISSDARFNDAITFTSSGDIRNKKFVDPLNVDRNSPDTEYFLRLAEVYLIYSEAILRGNNNIVASSDALNVIRARSNNPLILANNKADLLKAIRIEKILELGAESGEEWYDLVRFHTEGDININDHKSLPSENHLILPLPEKTIMVSDGVIKQNPGY